MRRIPAVHGLPMRSGGRETRPVLIDAETDARIRDRYVIRLPPVWRRGGAGP